MPKHTPDPGNAGVGRGKKLSVLRAIPCTEDGLTKFFLSHFEKFICGFIRFAAAFPGCGTNLRFGESHRFSVRFNIAGSNRQYRSIKHYRH